MNEQHPFVWLLFVSSVLTAICLTEGQRPQKFYHYTDKNGYKGIYDSQHIWASTDPRHARFGVGTYFTAMKPSNTPQELSKNNYNNQNQLGRVGYAIELKQQDLPGIQRVGPADRDIYIIDGPGGVNISNLPVIYYKRQFEGVPGDYTYYDMVPSGTMKGKHGRRYPLDGVPNKPRKHEQQRARPGNQSQRSRTRQNNQRNG